MNKKLLTIIAVVAIFALAIPAFAANVAGLNSEQAQKINALHQQMIKLRMQMIDEYQAAGQITEEQAAQMKNNLQNRLKYLEDNPDASFGPGMGRGPGMGFRQHGFGGGFCGNCPYNTQQPAAQN